MLLDLVSATLTTARATTSTTNPLWYVALTTVLAAIPILIGLFTSFVKVSVVLGMVKSALGTQHAPGTLVTMALSLAITGYTMFPVLEESARKLPSQSFAELAEKDVMELGSVLTPAMQPWRSFLEKHSGSRERAVLEQALHPELTAHPPAVSAIPTQSSNVPASLAVLLPSFLLTELKEAFAMGFVILLPCLIVDLIVANLLMGLGMMMVTPTLITLPLKLFLFVVTDAWLLITQGLINSYTL